MQQRLPDIHEVAMGKWAGLLPQFGVPAAHMDGKHHPCPLCGGKDRWRWNEKGKPNPGYHCNQCGHGSGVDLVMRLHSMTFADACKAIKEKAGDLRPEWKRAASPQKFDAAANAARVWTEARPLVAGDLVSTYLRRRGIVLDSLPNQIRFAPRMRYSHGDGKAPTYHPAMIAQFVGPDTKQRTVHVTYLDNEGRKARLEPDRKLAPGPVPKGGAVRLSPSAETMGIAEGIETALSAAALNEVPVWAALNAELMMQWEPPVSVKCVIVFGDNDQHFKGHAAAYALANRLSAGPRKLRVEVRIPDLVDTDWNDLLESQSEAA